MQRDSQQAQTMDENTETILPCAEKMVFDTIAAAQATATTSEWRYGSKLKVYKCRYCHLYHLSSNFDE